jgi:hypothetical protein
MEAFSFLEKSLIYLPVEADREIFARFQSEKTNLGLPLPYSLSHCNESFYQLLQIFNGWNLEWLKFKKGERAMNASATPRTIFHECDFCKIQGTLGSNIFNKDGWYFCKPCLLEVEYELKKRKAQIALAGKP